MFLPQDDFFRNSSNHLFDEGVAYCRKQQFEKAYQCFKKHLAQNSFCQETFQMLSYCHYKFSENVINNVSDLSIITKAPKSHSRSYEKLTVRENSHNSSSSALQNSRSSKSRNYQERSSFISSSFKLSDKPKLSRNQQKPLSNFSNSAAVSDKQKVFQVESKPLRIFSPENEPHKVGKSITIESAEENDSSTRYYLKQLFDCQLRIELSLRNMDSTVSDVELELSNLLAIEKKINANVLSLMNFVSCANSYMGTTTYRTQPVNFGGIYTQNITGLCQPVDFGTQLVDWSFLCRGMDESKGAVVNATAANYFEVNYEPWKGVLDDNALQLPGNVCWAIQEGKTEKKSVLEELPSQTPLESLPVAYESSKVANSGSERLPAVNVSLFEQNLSTKRKLDLCEAYFHSSPRKKLQMCALLNNAVAKRKLVDTNEDDSKRLKVQSCGKAPLLNCGSTFKMLKELQLMSDLSVCDADPGCGVIPALKFARRAQLFSEGTCLKKVNLGFQSTRNAAIQTELSVSCNVKYSTKLCSNTFSSSSTVSLPHSNSIIPTMPLKKFHAPVTTHSACSSNRLNIFINQMLCEIKDSLSFIPVDFMPLSSNPDSALICIREVKNALMLVNEVRPANDVIFRLFVHGHYIEFSNMRVYQVDPFWSRRSIHDNSLATCQDLSLFPSESRSEIWSSFLYPVCILLHSLSTDLYNLTLLAGPFRIRFVNFNSYFNGMGSSNRRDD